MGFLGEGFVVRIKWVVGVVFMWEMRGNGKGGVPSMTAFSVPQHKPICTIAFGGSVRIARVSACPRKGRASLFSRQRES